MEQSFFRLRRSKHAVRLSVSLKVSQRTCRDRPSCTGREHDQSRVRGTYDGINLLCSHRFAHAGRVCQPLQFSIGLVKNIWRKLTFKSFGELSLTRSSCSAEWSARVLQCGCIGSDALTSRQSLVCMFLVPGNDILEGIDFVIRLEVLQKFFDQRWELRICPLSAAGRTRRVQTLTCYLNEAISIVIQSIGISNLEGVYHSDTFSFETLHHVFVLGNLHGQVSHRFGLVILMRSSPRWVDPISG